MIEKEIIKDQKETIHRLQDECMEKTKIILKLHQENERLRKRQITKNGFICDCEQNVKYRQALEEIREIASAIINGKHITNDIEGHLKELSKHIIEKIGEVLK